MPTRSFLRPKLATLVTMVLLAAAGCSDEAEPNLPPGGPGPEPLIDTKTGTPTIRQIMGRLTKGPNSLTPVIGKELAAAAPDWKTIEPQTDEYARLAAALEKNTPRKGSPESWAKLSAAFTESAAALDKAAKAKDRDAALDAHNELTGSCMECHRQHRGGAPAWVKWAGRLRDRPEKTPASGQDLDQRPGRVDRALAKVRVPEECSEGTSWKPRWALIFCSCSRLRSGAFPWQIPFRTSSPSDPSCLTGKSGGGRSS